MVVLFSFVLLIVRIIRASPTLQLSKGRVGT